MIKAIIKYLSFTPIYRHSAIRSGIKTSTIPNTLSSPTNLGVTKAISSEYYARDGFFDPVLYDKVMAAKLNY